MVGHVRAPNLVHRLARLACGVAIAALPAVAGASTLDVTLRGLGRPTSDALSDPATVRYRGLVSELTLALAPPTVEPGETLGLSGFAYGFTLTGTPIHSTARFWQGQPGAPVLEGGAVPGALW